MFLLYAHMQSVIIEVVDNIVDETILNDYIVTKHRFRNDIIILKDKKWYLDTFSQLS